MEKRLANFAILLVISFIAYWAQCQFFLENDVIYLTHAAEKLLQGGTYTKNFFETNPPLIFYLYLPAILFKTYFKVKIITAVRVYFIALVWLQIFFINYFLKKFFLPSSDRYTLLIGVLLIDLFLPGCEFAQKEHFVLLFTMPYWFLATLRLANIKVNFLIVLLTGLMAACGFALKPFFLLPLGLVEVYVLLKTRNIRAWFRPELLVIGFFIVIYLISIWVFQPEYFQVILPLVSRYYFSSTAEPLGLMLERLPSLYCITILGLSPLIYRVSGNKNLAIIFSLALAGFVLAYVIPHTSWYYHVLPALGMACLLTLLLTIEIKNLILRLCFGLLFLAVPGYFVTLLFFSEFAIARNSILPELMVLANQSQAVRVYCIPTHQACSNLSAYSHAEYVSRFPSLWILKGLIELPENKYTSQDKKDLLNRVAEDIYTQQPDYLIFNTQIKLGKLQNAKDYLAYFSANKVFQAAVKRYHFKANVGPYQVFSRKPS